MRIFLSRNDHDPDMIEIYSGNKAYLWAVFHIDLLSDGVNEDEIYKYIRDNEKAECELSLVIK